MAEPNPVKQQKNMTKWTYIKPTVPGVYFVHAGVTLVAEIRRCTPIEGSNDWIMDFPGGKESKHFEGCRFYGPLVAPEYDCLHEEQDHGICCDCGKQCDPNAPDFIPGE